MSPRNQTFSCVPKVSRALSARQQTLRTFLDSVAPRQARARCRSLRWTGRETGDGDAPGEADSDGVGYLSYDENASDTEEPSANHRDENDPLGQAPMNVPLLPSRGKYDQRAAKRKPMQPAKSHHKASLRLRNLLPQILKTTLTFGIKTAAKSTAGKMWQCFCLVHKHGHPLTEQREHGGVSLEDGACGDDSDCIVALTPGRLGDVAAGFEAVDDLRILHIMHTPTWRMHYVVHCTVHATYSVVHGTACCQPMMCGVVWSILD
jgi:hypothetical protein